MAFQFWRHLVPATALQQLIDLQRSLYDRALTEAREYSGADSVAILGQVFNAGFEYSHSFLTSRPQVYINLIHHICLTLFDTEGLKHSENPVKMRPICFQMRFAVP